MKVFVVSKCYLDGDGYFTRHYVDCVKNIEDAEIDIFNNISNDDISLVEKDVTDNKKIVIHIEEKTF